MRTEEGMEEASGEKRRYKIDLSENRKVSNKRKMKDLLGSFECPFEAGDHAFKVNHLALLHFFVYM